jgi:hypothetical protein
MNWRGYLFCALCAVVAVAAVFRPWPARSATPVAWEFHVLDLKGMNYLEARVLQHALNIEGRNGFHNPVALSGTSVFIVEREKPVAGP